MTANANNTNFLPVGRVVAAACANEVLMHEDIIAALDRHQTGDWGEVCKADWKANDIMRVNAASVFYRHI